MAELQKALPSGWETKFDLSTGAWYYVNHQTKTTTWDDPRQSYKTGINHQRHVASMQTEHVPLQDMKNNVHGGSYSVRSSNAIQDTSLSNVINVDELVNKIKAKYPTVGEAYIRVLLKKYRNRDNVVMNVLAAEKHPTTCSLHNSGTSNITSSPSYRTSRLQDSIVPTETDEFVGKIGAMFPTVSDTHIRLLLKKYMKSIFPKAEETVILDVLWNNDNNIQKSSEILKEMGFAKRDIFKLLQQQAEDKAKAEEEEVIRIQSDLNSHEPKNLSPEDKCNIKANIQELYNDIPEKVISMALESVDFDETKARQILNIMVEEDKDKAKEAKAEEHDENESTAGNNLEVISTSQSRQSLKSLLKSDITRDKSNLSRLLEDQNSMIRNSKEVKVLGHNASIVKGPNENLLLEEYVNWQGPNKNIRQGPNKSLAKGPNSSLLCKRSYTPNGANSEMRKGPQKGLAKGSIFSQLKAVVGESRGK